MTTSIEELMAISSQLRERLDQIQVVKDNTIGTVEKWTDDITYQLEEVQGMLECESDLFTLRDNLKEELNCLQLAVERNRELKAKLQTDKKIKTQLVSDVRQEFEEMEHEIEELDSKLKNQNNHTPMILRLMKSHKPGPDINTKKEPSTSTTANHTDQQNL